MFLKEKLKMSSLIRGHFFSYGVFIGESSVLINTLWPGTFNKERQIILTYLLGIWENYSYYVLEMTVEVTYLKQDIC